MTRPKHYYADNAETQCSVEGCNQIAKYYVYLYDYYDFADEEFFEQDITCPFLCERHKRENEEQARGVREPRGSVYYPFSNRYDAQGYTKYALRKLSSIVSRVVYAIHDLSKQLARIIAENPNELDAIEWREMERMLASVFEELGFDVELTPSSKDGGKDIILSCLVSGYTRNYLVEVKHWRSGKLVGGTSIQEFVNVVMYERSDGGLYLSTSGYADSAFEALSEIDRQVIRLGDKDKVLNLCKTFVKSESGIWSAPRTLTELLFEHTK